jgi:hypothetical protein
VEQVLLGETRLSIQVGSMAIAAIFLLGAMLAGYRYIGWPPVIILACIIHERMAKAFCGGTRLPKMLMAP